MPRNRNGLVKRTVGENYNVLWVIILLKMWPSCSTAERKEQVKISYRLKVRSGNGCSCLVQNLLSAAVLSTDTHRLKHCVT